MGQDGSQSGRNRQQHLQPPDPEEHHQHQPAADLQHRLYLRGAKVRVPPPEQICTELDCGMDPRRIASVFIRASHRHPGIVQYDEQLVRTKHPGKPCSGAAALHHQSELQLRQPDGPVHPEPGGVDQPRAGAVGDFGALLRRFPATAASGGIHEFRQDIPHSRRENAGGPGGVLQHLQPRVSQHRQCYQPAGQPGLHHYGSDRRRAQQRQRSGRLVHLSGGLLVSFGIRGHRLYLAEYSAAQRPASGPIYVLRETWTFDRLFVDPISLLLGSCRTS
ncbi:hypothetical protein SBA4_2650015 [Candidatus Sulfopaludibacter sp. SbA4]|nr:hypothetical protein SBA4_2650015 [Candidatus Sulfopaludibacter sp. SbA4]